MAPSTRPDIPTSHPTVHPPNSSPPIQPATAPAPPILIALSGPTSTGKTTLAHTLLRLLPAPSLPPLIVHADDFYLPDPQIPVREEDGIQDWDCAGAVDWGRFWEVLEGVKQGGGEGERWLEGVRRQGGVDDGEAEADGVHAPSAKDGAGGGGKRGISGDVIERLRREVEMWPTELWERRFVIIEGFLLFGETVRERAREVFDVRVLLRTTRALAKRRRESRNGYVTLEGFWQDPEGYFDKVVWPGYVREHEWLFEGGDVEGRVKESSDVGEGIVVQPLGGREAGGVDEVLEWLVGVLREEMGRVVGEGKEEGKNI